MVLFLARCWLYKVLQKKVLPTHQRAFFYADRSYFAFVALRLYLQITFSYSWQAFQLSWLLPDTGSGFSVGLLDLCFLGHEFQIEAPMSMTIPPKAIYPLVSQNLPAIIVAEAAIPTRNGPYPLLARARKAKDASAIIRQIAVRGSR